MDKRFQGKICPFCKTPFEEGDVIVVCSVCEMPHHLSCWQENNGCTTFGCTGTIKETIGHEPGNNLTRSNTTYSNHNTTPNSKNMIESEGKGPTHRFETLFESEPNKIQGEIPVLIEKTSLIIDHQDENLMARCIFRSLTDKPIMAMLVDIVCNDVWGQQSGKIEDFQFLDLKTSRDSTFGQTKPVPIPNRATRAIDVIIKKILYSDRTMVDASAEVSVLPKQETLESFFGSIELKNEYVRESNERAKYTVVDSEEYWRCTCGAINKREDNRCYRCRSERVQLLSLLNPDLISKNLELYNEEKRLRAEREQAEREAQMREAEERLRLEREEKERKEKEEAERRAEEVRQAKAKRRKVVKRTGLVAAAVLLIVVSVYLIGWHIVPYYRYQNACEALDTQFFDEAYDLFVALGTYRDSSDKAVDTLYQKGMYLIGNGSYLEAATEFERISDYQDSKDQALYCRNEATYIEASALFEDEDYEGAAKAFTTISSYKDSKNLENECYYRLAEQLLVEKKYDEAYTNFKKLSSYKDSNDRANEAKYLYAIECFDAGDYKKAVTEFTVVKSYKDAADRISESEYQYALSLMNKSDWKAAADAFKKLGSYQDSSSRYLESYYQYGLGLQNSKSYTDAMAVFKALGSYQDSALRYNEMYYQHGLTLLNNKSYVYAVEVFSSLGNYQDSATKLNEAKYGYVSSHKNRTDTTTYSYLKDLRAAGYKDSSSIYTSLYGWKVSIVMNNSATNSTTNMTSVSKWIPWYCHIKLSGGPPGEKITVRASTSWPDGKTESLLSDKKLGDGSDGYFYFWYDRPFNAPSGTMRIQLYNNDSGEFLGDISVRVS